MSSRLIRQIAIQTLYQIDARNGVCDSDVEQAVMEMPYEAEDRQKGLEMARRAWMIHAQADEAATRLAPAWPTHRQPVVDRSILRLAYYELKSTPTPGRIVLDEAIELAKAFGTEHSPSFINGVLDRIMHELIAAAGQPASAEVAAPPATGDAWLDEALSPPPANPLAQPIVPLRAEAVSPPVEPSHPVKDQ